MSGPSEDTEQQEREPQTRQGRRAVCRPVGCRRGGQQTLGMRVSAVCGQPPQELWPWEQDRVSCHKEEGVESKVGGYGAAGAPQLLEGLS